jgi:hypothetical protein
MRWIPALLLAALVLAQQTAPQPKPAEKPDPDLARQIEIRRLVQIEVREQLQQMRAAGATNAGGDMNDLRIRAMETEVNSLRREVQSLQQAIWNLQSRVR